MHTQKILVVDKSLIIYTVNLILFVWVHFASKTYDTPIAVLNPSVLLIIKMHYLMKFFEVFLNFHFCVQGEKKGSKELKNVNNQIGRSRLL